MADHYTLLGVRPDADRAAIQAAYRALARQHHPDFGGDEATMAALNEAWAVLSDPGARMAYDSGRRRSRAPGGASPAPPPRPAGPLAAMAARRVPESAARKTLGFGRYADWTIAEIAAHDPDYLEWLARAPVGMGYRQEIYMQLARRPAPAGGGGTVTATRPARSRFRRRLW
jgi:curved DNA-binding protein CbpA